ncbi:TPA: gp53-like domain-containing protein [Escherichia coli]
MHRIDTKTAQKDKFGAGKNGFTRGNPQTGTPATDLDDDYFDMLQEELCSVVEASGASLEKGRHDQLLTALHALLLSRKNPFGDIKSDGTVKTALENLGLGEAAKQGVATTAQMQSGTATNLLPSVAAVMSLFSKRTFTAADYIRIPDVPGGLIIQWGSYATTGGTQTINLPVAFPNANIGTLAVLVGTTTVYGFVTTENRGQGAFDLHTRRSNAELAAAPCFTVSIGW